MDPEVGNLPFSEHTDVENACGLIFFRLATLCPSEILPESKITSVKKLSTGTMLD
uniref:Uncharacterized protein LOC8283401 n=1 Tax=Rhizophora mucronata TaxID=61149 RepID=A0A2P2MQ47_RHIMU